ncbi:MAG: hypothetical protein D6758_11455 [Gammaproteobacteria bacterium]|nr:MAG: hypothetical protein D6758_11455 [Gammaproteobacteria bacterium]
MKTQIKTQSLILAAALILPMGAFAGDDGLADQRSNDNSWITQHTMKADMQDTSDKMAATDLNTLPPTAAGRTTSMEDEYSGVRPAGLTAHEYKVRIFGAN